MKYILYHGSNNKFSKFSNLYFDKGQGSRGLGQGFYFNKYYNDAKYYGKFIYICEIQINKLLDLKNINDIIKKTTIVKLIKKYSKIIFDLKTKNATTKNYDIYYTYMFEKVLKNGSISSYGLIQLSKLIAQELTKLKGEKYNTFNIFQQLGYDGLKYGDEFNIFNSSQINIIQVKTQ